MRKLPQNSLATWQDELALYHKAVNQKRRDTNKIYSLHELQVCCIGKGKEHKKYEFGAKAAIVMTKTHCIIVGAKSLPVTNMTAICSRMCCPMLWTSGVALRKRRSATEVSEGEKGGRHHDSPAGIPITQGHGALQTQNPEKLRTPERDWPVIGHLKNDFRLARNYLKGTVGDAINLFLAAAAFNCRKWMNAVA